MDIQALADLAARLRSEVAKVILGHDEVLDLLLVATLAEGHALLEGVPGTAKTLLARCFARVLGLDYRRIQFTPDLMPGDVSGTNLFDFRTHEFVLKKGPVFTEVLLADEINRSPPKTQAALLEAMQERSVTIDGEHHDLGEAFVVLATQNPIEHEGTYPLPEAQLDRFLVKIAMGYPDAEKEFEMVMLHGNRSLSPPLESFGLTAVADRQSLLAARETVRSLHLSEPVARYVVELVRATREHPALATGASPRAATGLAAASRANAALQGRDYVIPDDVKALATPVLGHRITRTAAAQIEGTDAASVLDDVVAATPAPR